MSPRRKPRDTHVGREEPEARPNHVPWWLAPALLLAVLAVYQPALRGGLLWDDDKHVTAAELQSMTGLGRIWTELGATQQYYPVAHTAFWIQHRLWSDDTFGYHLVNAVLHALSAFLLALILARLHVPGAALAAFLFAVHPVHVESVAWITELKNTLSCVFYFSAALAYLRFSESRAPRAYGLALVLFLLALGTKTVTATLPAALLVVFWWQRGRLDGTRDVRPMVPFLAVGASAGLFTAWIERTIIGAAGAAYGLSGIERVLLAGRAAWFYLWKLVWPADLMFIYPRWDVSQAVWWQYVFPLAAVAVLGAAWRLRNTSRAPLAVALLFGGTLFPALGFFNVYPFRFSYVADHFQYLASVPIMAVLGAGLLALGARVGTRLGTELGARRSAFGARGVTLILSVAVLAPLGWQAREESGNYASAELLYRETIRRNPGAWMAHSNLASELLDDRPAEALLHVEAALRLKGDIAEAHNNLGMIRHREGRAEEALASYRRAASLEPDLAQAHNNQCVALWQLSRAAEAAAACEAALELDADYPEALYNLGVTRQILGQADGAARLFERAAAVAPGYADARYQVGLLRQREGRIDEAIAEFRAAIAARPAFAAAHNDLGGAMVLAGRPEEAVSAFRQALLVQPAYADAAFNLATTLVGLGRPAEAVNPYEAALAARPDDWAAHNNLGVVLLGLGRPRDAAGHFREAIRLAPDSADARENLAKALRSGGS